MDPRPRLIAYYMEVWDLPLPNAREVAAWDFARILARANEKGATYTELALKVGVTRGRIHQIIQKAHRLRRAYARSGTYCLSAFGAQREDPYEDHAFAFGDLNRMSRRRARQHLAQLERARFIVGRPGEPYPKLTVTFT